MLTIDESTVIEKPRSEVFAFFSDPDNVVVYSSNVVDYEVVSGEATEIGRKAHLVAKVVGAKVEADDELVEFVDGERYKIVAEKATIPYAIEMSFADEGSGTKVSWHQESESLKGVFKFADNIVLKMYARDVRSNLEKAKTLLEA